VRTLLVPCLLAACAPGVPEEPTWLADVRPILAANCVRCHRQPSIGGAPASFRLDVYEGAPGMRGARDLAPFVAARAGRHPPDGARLSDRQVEILERWADSPLLGARAGNRPPSVRVNELASNPDLELRLDVVVEDPDGDLVFGELRAGAHAVLPLRAGRQTLVLDVGSMEPGVHSLTAIVDDGDGPMAVELGARTVAPRPNTAPRVELGTPARDALLVGAEGPATIGFVISDPDPGDRLALDLTAVHGETAIEIARGLPVSPGPGSHAWDLAGVPAGTSWRLVARIADGRTARVAESGRFLVSHSTSVETLASVKPILDGWCARCHDALLPGPDLATRAGILAVRGLAWRKLAQSRDMPPASTTVLFPDAPPLSEELRARLAGWLLAGAPP
jgi:hypothetical protein